VVAEEVQRLAERSGDATTTDAALVKTIQTTPRTPCRHGTIDAGVVEGTD